MLYFLLPRLFSKSCSICQNTFKNTDFVLPLCQNNYCHAQCLLCTICGKILTSGCKYTISNWSVVCGDCTLPTTLPSLSEISNSHFYSNKIINNINNSNSQISEIDRSQSNEIFITICNPREPIIKF